MTSPSAFRDRRPVPLRTMLVAIGLVLATALLLYVVLQVAQVLTWLVIALFFGVALAPLVGWVQRRLLGGKRRALATFLVFVVVFAVLAALVTAFVVPLVGEGTKVATALPDQIAAAKAGRGPVGDLLQRTHALEWVQHNQDKIRSFASGLTAPAASIVSGVATGLVGLLTVIVLAYLIVLEGPQLVDGVIALFAPETGERIRRVGADCAKSVTGYISGNLLISVICGGLTYVVLLIMGVPFAGLIGLFVGIADLLPLVGATIGGAVAVLAGFLHSEHGRHRGAGLLRGLPAAGEPPAAAADLRPHREAQPADRDRGHPGRGGAQGDARSAARHPGGEHDPGDPPRRLGPPARAAQDRAHRRGGAEPVDSGAAADADPAQGEFVAAGRGERVHGA